jgi:hypothetical protein
MKAIYFIYALVRLGLVVFFFLFLFGIRSPISWSNPWLPLGVVSLLVVIEEITALGISRSFSGMFTAPAEADLPAIVVESDRTFVEVLCAAAAAILALALGEHADWARTIPKTSLTGCVLLCFTYLNLQGASVVADSDDNGQHTVKLAPNRSTVLLILRNLIYWTFLYGLIFAVVAPK